MNGVTVTMTIFSIQHDRHGLAEVERISDDAAGLAERLHAVDGVTGTVLLSTCNRVEVLLDAAPGVTTSMLRAVINERFATPPAWDVFAGEAALGHLFRVAAGLESMVVGEREIAGQLRRALGEAQDAGRTTLTLTIAVEEALKASRRVARETTLEGAGRSVVGAGLDLVDADWPATKRLLIGTGSYAGAVVAAARARGVDTIAVHSASGRGAEFAASHGTGLVRTVAEGLVSADLVVTCRGQGSTVVGVDDVTRHATFLDLSLRRDVDPRVGGLTGVRLIDLPTIQDALGGAIGEDTRRAQAIVDEGIADALTKLRSRIVDPAVVGLRESVMALVADEVARLPQRPLTHDDAALALRRLATRLLHVPSSRARLAAEQGRTDEYLHAMEELYGIGAPVDINPNEMEELTCPLTNLAVRDLETTRGVSEAV